MMPSPGKDGAARAIRPPSLWDAVIPLVVLTGLLSGSLVLFGLDALDGPIQTALVLCVLVAGLIALKNGYTWEQVEQSSRSAMSSITSAIFILLAVGALIGVWNLSGTIPTLVYYGIEILSPSWYFAATALICGLVALSIGSSWTTAGTIGVGLVGIATMIGVSPEITAGAVISGAYLGDKLSPLSETTILTANIVGVDVHAHVRRQAWTSVPAFGAAVVVKSDPARKKERSFAGCGVVSATATTARSVGQIIDASASRNISASCIERFSRRCGTNATPRAGLMASEPHGPDRQEHEGDHREHGGYEHRRPSLEPALEASEALVPP
jgi:hypothetical protein